LAKVRDLFFLQKNIYFCRQNLFLPKMIYFRFVAKWMFNLLLWGGFITMAWICFSCDDFCEEPNRTAVVVSFFDAKGAPLKVINVEIRGVGDKDSILYDPKAKAPIYGGKDFSQVLLPVNPTADSISFSIKNNTLPADTITIHYTRHNGFISSKCGCVTYAEILFVEILPVSEEPEEPEEPEELEEPEEPVGPEEPKRTENTIKRLEVVNPSVTTVSYRQGVANAENIRIYY